MSYNKKGYYIRVRAIQKIAQSHYQSYHDSCHTRIWKKYVYPYYGICYQTYLNYLKVQLPEEDES